MIRRWAICAIAACLVLVVAVACADNTEDRQFANDPRTASATEPQPPSTPVGARPVSTSPPLASPEALVDRRGAPPAIYAYVQGKLRYFDGADLQVVVDGPVAAFDASPSGDRVAVAMVSTSDAGETVYSIDVFDPEGNLDQQFDDVLTAPPAGATPTPDDSLRGDVSLSWAPQGNRLLLSHASGELVDISLTGNAQQIETRSPITGTVKAAWSPRGDTIGILIRRDDGRGELALLEPGDEPAAVNVIAPVGDASGQVKSVEQFAWKANGSGVVYLEMQRDDSGASGGRIISWDRATNTSQIVATGGQAGPSGSITSFMVAPDGKAVVYQIALPTDDGWSFNSLYVRSLRTGQVYRVPVGGDASVIDAWWMNDGLVWTERQGSTESPGPIAVVVATADGSQTEVARVAPEVDATPIASPVVASPVESVSDGTQGAAQVASPESTAPESATPQS